MITLAEESKRRNTQYYAYDGDQVIAEYEGGSLKRKFIYGPGIDEPVMMIDVTTSTKYYYHFDGLGSVVALSNSIGDIVERYSYDVFGEPNRVSDVNNPYLFTGRRFDTETANYYYRARYYKPSIGRFLQPDPIPSLNLYTYVGNNPTNWLDPLGLCKRLGIHSTGSHSWTTITNTKTGKTSSYGLWHDVKSGIRLRPDSDVRLNKEPPASHVPGTNRYYDLSDEQHKHALDFIYGRHQYRYPTNNCSSWATDCWRKVTGEDLNADRWDPWYYLGVEYPETLMESILEANKSDKGP